MCVALLLRAMAVRLLRCSCRVGATRTPPSFLRCFSTGLSSSSSAASSPAPSGRAGRSRRDDDDRRSDLVSAVAAASQQRRPPSTAAASSPRLPLRLQTPSELVKELDRFIVGQADAKKAVAVALRHSHTTHTPHTTHHTPHTCTPLHSHTAAHAPHSHRRVQLSSHTAVLSSSCSSSSSVSVSAVRGQATAGVVTVCLTASRRRCFRRTSSWWVLRGVARRRSPVVWLV